MQAVVRLGFSSIEHEAPALVSGFRLRAAVPNRGRRGSPRRRAMAWLLVGVSFWTLVACGIEPEPPPAETERLDLVAQAPIAGALVEFALPPGVTLVAVEPLRPHLLLRSSVRDDRIRVAWMAETAMAGAQLRFTLERDEDQKGSLDIVSASAFDSSVGEDLGAAVLVWRTIGSATVLDAPLTPDAFDHASGTPPTLSPSFADHPLGDVNADGELDVRDGLVLLGLLRTGWSWTDYTKYHGDLDGDDVTDVSDLALMLDRLVDPQLPARLHVKPRQLSFVQIDPATDRDAVVLVANQGVQPFVDLTWTPPAGVSAGVTGGIAGQSVALELTLPAAERRGWRPGFLRVTASGDEAEVRVGQLVALVAGQSNASGRGVPLTGWPEVSRDEVRMLGNDYRWRNATEPLDDATGQIEFDWISIDSAAAYSFGTWLGNRLFEATGFETVLIPAARGATQVEDWLPRANPVDRDSLFGSANFRSQVSAALRSNPVTTGQSPSEGGPVSVIVWYQGESDVSSSRRSTFWNYTNQVMNAFYAELGSPVVYVQLASHCVEQNHVQQHAVADLQRRMETEPGYDEERQGRHMVVAFDLPRSDCIHLSAYGHRLLAERIELAVRQHVLGEDVDGVGPRLVAVSHAGTEITLRTTHLLDANPLDPMLFTVFDGPPTGSLDDVAGYGGNVIDIVSVVRDAGDPTAVRLTLARVPTGTPHVRYMARPNQRPITDNSTPADPDVWETVADGVVRAADGGLPLPTFGPVTPFGGP